MPKKYLDSDGLARVWAKIKALIPTVNNATLTIKRNNTTIDSFTANAASDKTINITVPTSAADISALPASTKYGASIIVSLDTTNYQITTTLKDQDGNTLGTAQMIDLPVESVVVSGSYNATTKKVVLTLQNGSTIEFSVADLVAGLQTEITSTNKLSADLVDDSSATHKFVTSAQITKLNGIATGAEVNVQADWSVSDNTSDAFIKNKPSIPTKVSDLTNDAGYTTNTGNVTAAATLTANKFVVGDGSSAVKVSTMQPATSSTTWSASSDVYVPTMKAISTYVTGRGYITDAGVTSFNGLTGAVTYEPPELSNAEIDAICV